VENGLDETDMITSRALTSGLARFVDDVRLMAPVGEHSLAHVEGLPDGRVSLLLRITEGSLAPEESGARRGDVSVVGTRTRPIYKTVQDVPLVIVVRLRPGGAPAVLGLPANELTDCIVRLEDLWGAEGLALRDQLLSAAGHEAMLRLLEGAIEARASREAERPPARLARQALGLITKSRTPICVNDLAATIGVSSRHLRRAFTESVGIGPKEFARIVRFQRAAGANLSQTSWTRVAMDAGYYDQAHMIRDFREFTGTTPDAFVKRPSRYPW
jgi:AraC-like DNA-binding protein